MFEQASSVCTVLSNPLPLVGKHVYVSGTYLAEPHGRILFDSRCTGEIKLRPSFKHDSRHASERLKLALSAKRNAKIPVVYYGVLKSVPIISNCSESQCFAYSLEEAKLTAARNPKGNWSD
jgi:hypothetical protein